METIHATDVSKHYGGITALASASFQARRGEVHALLGENGAGKSTFVQILAGAVQADVGMIELDGEPFRASTPAESQAAGIAAVFQELSLLPDLTVEENVWFRHEPLSWFRTVRRMALRKATLELFERYHFPPLLAGREVRRLPLAERQLVEIAKALAQNPSTLILDEATSALGPWETHWLLALARKLADQGLLVIFISHRLGEVRQVADRITIFRNGCTVCCYETARVDDDTIIADILGRPMNRLYPERAPTAKSSVALSVKNLDLDHRLFGVSLDLHEGEVLGVAGLQGHGQRELFHALFGLKRIKAGVELWGRSTILQNSRHALTTDRGIGLVPEDRGGEGLLLSKSVRENLTLSSVARFTRFGFIDSTREAALVSGISQSLRIQAQPDRSAGSLSGGNQQKVVFGKMLLTKARVLLLYDPTRGVDVGAKGEIYQLICDLCRQGYAILFYSSDLAELTHLADRVAVFRNGRIATVLDRMPIAETDILREMLGGATNSHGSPVKSPVSIAPATFVEWRERMADRAPLLIACALLVLLVAIYGSLRRNVFSLEEINLDTAETMTLLLAATGETIVLLRGGIDLSIAGMISLGTALAATHLGANPLGAAAWTLLILLLGLAAGIVNGLIIAGLKLQPFLVTLATWSVLAGAALVVLPVDGGVLPAGWMGFGAASYFGLSTPVWLLIVLSAFWVWYPKTRLGLTIRAAGSKERSVYLSGPSPLTVSAATYGLSGFFAACASLYLTTQTGTGLPTVGNDYILPSVAAAVIGGVSLFGGRGWIWGAAVGAFIMTIIGNLVFVLSVSSYWQPIVSGAILLVAVLAGSLTEKAARRNVAG